MAAQITPGLKKDFGCRRRVRQDLKRILGAGAGCATTQKRFLGPAPCAPASPNERSAGAMCADASILFVAREAISRHLR